MDAAAPRPTLSVVVPIYNESAVLPALEGRLRAVLAASCPDYEVVFVDDGSVDESPAIEDRMAVSDCRFCNR